MLFSTLTNKKRDKKETDKKRGREGKRRKIEKRKDRNSCRERERKEWEGLAEERKLNTQIRDRGCGYMQFLSKRLQRKRYRERYSNVYLLSP